MRRPGFPDPDWAKYATGVSSRAQAPGHLPLGDSIKWGGQVVQQVNNDPALIIRTFDSLSFIRAQTNDTYARTWALLGTVSAPPTVWLLPIGQWTILLEISQGSGQNVITQLFDLRSLTTIGIAGGYSVDTFTTGFEKRSFAIVGGVLGQQWQARVRIAFAVALVPATAITTSIIGAPFAAGTGL